jgi:hypothetical protein
MEAAKLLGGYATGTLSEAERQALFAAALDRQELFDALMDEEALRELLSDPAVKAQLIAALSQPAPPKAIPFWRRPGLMGAAAGLIVAATAGLAYLRSPEKAPPPLQASAKPPQAEAAAVPAAPQATQTRAKQKVPAAPQKERAQPFHMVEAPAPPPPAPVPKPLAPTATAGAPVLAREDAARMNVQAVALQAAEARQQEAKKAEASKSAAAMMDAVGPTTPEPSVARMKAKTIGTVRPEATVPQIVPTWTLEVRPDGSTGLTIAVVRGQQVVVLRRRTAGVDVLSLRAMKAGEEALVRWQGDVRLAAGDVLDLYLLSTPVADPALLPETGPVDGDRVRIYPPERK